MALFCEHCRTPSLTIANGIKRCSVCDVSPHDHAVALGKRGGVKGGLARATALSPERRTEIARMGGKARWGKEPDPTPSAPVESKQVVEVQTSDLEAEDLFDEREELLMRLCVIQARLTELNW